MSEERPRRASDASIAARSQSAQPDRAAIDDDVPGWIDDAGDEKKVRCPHADCKALFALVGDAEKRINADIKIHTFADRRCPKCKKPIRIFFNHIDASFFAETPKKLPTAAAGPARRNDDSSSGEKSPAKAAPPPEKAAAQRPPAPVQKAPPEEPYDGPSLDFDVEPPAADLDAPPTRPAAGDGGEELARMRQRLKSDLQDILQQVRGLKEENDENTGKLRETLQQQVEALGKLTGDLGALDKDVKVAGKTRGDIFGEIARTQRDLVQTYNNLSKFYKNLDTLVNHLNQKLGALDPGKGNGAADFKAPRSFAQEELLQELRRRLFSPDFAELAKEYRDWLSERAMAESWSEVTPEIPDLLDIVEFELREWKNSNKQDVPAAERQRVIDVLENVFQHQEAWRQRVRLMRFPQPGEPFDDFRHRLVRTEETADASQHNKVSEVLRSGYVFKDSKAALREAHVVMYIPPQEGQG